MTINICSLAVLVITDHVIWLFSCKTIE